MTRATQVQTNTPHTTSQTPARERNPQATARAVAMATSFVAAFLVFSVQPHMGKRLLPLLGGAPAVWTTCLMFFQGLLLGGYFYAHFLTRIRSIAVQMSIHLACMALSVLALPFAAEGEWSFGAAQHPVLTALYILLRGCGAAYFFVSASAPLFQHWYSRSRLSDAHDPYFLYASSNAGSLLALLTYPFLMEPFLHLKAQGYAWAALYLVLMGLVAVLGTLLKSQLRIGEKWIQNADPLAPSAQENPTLSEARPFDFWAKASVFFLAFIPSALLGALSSHLTEDVTPIPLIWIIPLSLYLLAFILGFSKSFSPKNRWLQQLNVIALVTGMIAYLSNFFVAHFLITITLQSAVFFLVSTAFLKQLSDRRPQVQHLTSFYLVIAVSGFVGGVFNVFVFPHSFNKTLEYPILLGAGLVLQHILSPRLDQETSRTKKALWLVYSLGFLIYPLVIFNLLRNQKISDYFQRHDSMWSHDKVLLSAMLVTLLFTLIHRIFKQYSLSLLALLFGLFSCYSIAQMQVEILYSDRTFFGALHVKRFLNPDINVLYHGTTIHGLGEANSELQKPLGYYHEESALGKALKIFQQEGKIKSAGILGLGTGSMAGLFSEDVHIQYFEIDPAIAQVAQDTRFFRFLKNQKNNEIILGDARKSLENIADGTLDLIYMDAFTSDAIPIHLLTQEAFALYRKKLSENGIIMVHISNRHFDLRPQIKAQAQLLGVQAISLVNGNDFNKWVYATESVVLTNNPAITDKLKSQINGKLLSDVSPSIAWTDENSSILPYIKRN